MPEIDARSVLIQLADDARPSKEEARINGGGGLLEKDGRGETKRKKLGREKEEGEDSRNSSGRQTLAAYANTFYAYLTGIKKPSFSSNALFPSNPFPRPIVPCLSRTSVIGGLDNH